MPYRSKVPCRHPGCAALVEPGTKYCDAHKSLHPEEVRSAGSRGYGRAWQKASKQFLAANPLCVSCAAEGRYADELRTVKVLVDGAERHGGVLDLLTHESALVLAAKKENEANGIHLMDDLRSEVLDQETYENPDMTGVFGV